MTTYRVRWEIDVDAETPQEAVIQAHGHATRPGTTATVYDVQDHDAGPALTLDVAELLNVGPLLESARYAAADMFNHEECANPGHRTKGTTT